MVPAHRFEDARSEIISYVQECDAVALAIRDAVVDALQRVVPLRSDE